MIFAAVSLLVTASPEAQGGVSHCGSIFVFVPSQEDVTELAEKLQHCLQEVLKQQQQQQPHLQNPPVEVVCLAPGMPEYSFEADSAFAVVQCVLLRGPRVFILCVSLSLQYFAPRFIVHRSSVY